MTNTEATLHAMISSIERQDLLKHPFYQAWNAGALAVEELATYAREYGAFIEVLDRGWTALNEPEAAAAERYHVTLWGDFAQALGTTVSGSPKVTEVKALVEMATQAFSSAPEAAGALYAFEVQQPMTAQTKLQGLDTHYRSLSPKVRPYFEAHAVETGEDAIIEDKLAHMSDGERERAAKACERMSRALWDALSGIHAGVC